MLLPSNDPIELGLAAFDYTVDPLSAGQPGQEAYLTRNMASISEILQDAGYRTCTVGKWHLGGPGHGGWGPEELGFDRSSGIYTGGANHWNQGPVHVNARDPEVMAQIQCGEIPQAPYHENGQPADRPIGICSDDLWTSKLMKDIDQDRDGGKPFFACAAFTTAHVPLQAPDFPIDKHYDRYLELGFDGLHRAGYEAQKQTGLRGFLTLRR